MEKDKIYFWEKPVVSYLIELEGCQNERQKDIMRVASFLVIPIFLIGLVSLTLRGILKRV